MINWDSFPDFLPVRLTFKVPYLADDIGNCPLTVEDMTVRRSCLVGVSHVIIISNGMWKVEDVQTLRFWCQRGFLQLVYSPAGLDLDRTSEALLGSAEICSAQGETGAYRKNGVDDEHLGLSIVWWEAKPWKYQES